MRYLTKEWYESMQKTDMYIPLKTSKKAENFSEEYYNELYKQEERRWIKLQKETSNVKFKDAFPEYIEGNVLNKEEQKEYNDLQMQFHESVSFDLVQAKKQFSQLQKDNIKYLKQKLPPEILNKVADIRVLSLNRATDSIKKEITDYCMEQNTLVQKALKDYQKYYDKELKNGKDKFIKSSSLHDSLIIDIIKKQDKLIIELDSSESFSDFKSIIFENYRIIEEEMNFINGWWLYEEIYRIDNQYELHILIDVPINAKKSKLGYLTIRARNIIYI